MIDNRDCRHGGTASCHDQGQSSRPEGLYRKIVIWPVKKVQSWSMDCAVFHGQVIGHINCITYITVELPP